MRSYFILVSTASSQLVICIILRPPCRLQLESSSISLMQHDVYKLILLAHQTYYSHINMSILQVIMASTVSNKRIETTLNKLLPQSFGPKSLTDIADEQKIK